MGWGDAGPVVARGWRGSDNTEPDGPPADTGGGGSCNDGIVTDNPTTNLE